jgi:preprotein translocase subunit SecB
MESTKQNKLIFLGADVVNVQYQAFKIFEEGVENSLDLKIDAKVFYPEELKNSFGILLSATCEVKDSFSLNVSVVGKFETEENISHENRSHFVNVNAPAIVFPYLRSFVSTFSANCGDALKTIIIPTQFFAGEIEEVKVD